MPTQTQQTSRPAGQRLAGRTATALLERPGEVFAARDVTEPGHDVRPFAVRLDELRRTHNLTFRALQARLQACAKPGERGVNHSHLSGLASGRGRPTPQVVELVARAFDMAPQSFIEWRLWQVQELFDPERSDGFDAAVAQLLAFFDDAPADVLELNKGEARKSRRDVFALRRLTA